MEDFENQFHEQVRQHLIRLAEEQAQIQSEMMRLFPHTLTNPLQPSFQEITRAKLEVVSLARTMGMDTSTAEAEASEAYHALIRNLNEVNLAALKSRQMVNKLRGRS